MLTVGRERGSHRKGKLRNTRCDGNSMSMTLDREGLINSTSTHGKQAHQDDYTTECHEQHIETFRLSRHHVFPFIVLGTGERTRDSCVTRRSARPDFSWPAGTFHIMSVPEVDANQQDEFLRNPGLVF